METDCVRVDRYYEWLKKGKERLPHFTKYKDGRLVLFAGLYDVAHIEGIVHCADASPFIV